MQHKMAHIAAFGAHHGRLMPCVQQAEGEEDRTSLLHAPSMEEVPTQQLVDTLRMPLIHLKSCRVKHTVWQIFKAHHYLVDTMHCAARCTLFVWQQVRSPCLMRALAASILRLEAAQLLEYLHLAAVLKDGKHSFRHRPRCTLPTHARRHTQWDKRKTHNDACGDH
jgi:hypothetical protein